MNVCMRVLCEYDNLPGDSALRYFRADQFVETHTRAAKELEARSVCCGVVPQGQVILLYPPCFPSTCR